MTPIGILGDSGVGIRMDLRSALKRTPLLGIQKDPPHGARFVRANNEPREGGQISDGQEDIAHGTTGHRPTTENEAVDQGDQPRETGKHRRVIRRILELAEQEGWLDALRELPSERQL